MATAYAVPDDPKKAADEAETLIYSVARQNEKEEVVQMRDLVDESLVQLEHIQQRDSAFAGVPTGFHDLDELLSGLQRGNLIVVAARPGRRQVLVRDEPGPQRRDGRPLARRRAAS